MSHSIDTNTNFILSIPRPSWTHFVQLSPTSPISVDRCVPYLIAILLLASVVVASFRQDKLSEFPVLSGSKNEYLRNGRMILARGMKKYGSKPFRVNTGLGGGIIILNSSVIPEVKNDHRFDSTKFLLQVT